MPTKQIKGKDDIWTQDQTLFPWGVLFTKVTLYLEFLQLGLDPWKYKGKFIREIKGELSLPLHSGWLNSHPELWWKGST